MADGGLAGAPAAAAPLRPISSGTPARCLLNSRSAVIHLTAVPHGFACTENRGGGADRAPLIDSLITYKHLIIINIGDHAPVFRIAVRPAPGKAFTASVDSVFPVFLAIEVARAPATHVDLALPARPKSLRFPQARATPRLLRSLGVVTGAGNWRLGAPFPEDRSTLRGTFSTMRR